MARRNDEYFLLVVCDGENRIVGTGSLIVERKFIHSLGLVGHIEDIAVEKNQQGLKLGLRIIQSLDHVAAQVGCYKVLFSLRTILRFPSVRGNCLISTPTLTVCNYRVSSIAPKPTKGSISSVASDVPASRWPITMIRMPERNDDPRTRRNLYSLLHIYSISYHIVSYDSSTYHGSSPSILVLALY